jgi:endonuclease/exonuclease/phosphatase family metal-dependent hydrolase
MDRFNVLIRDFAVIDVPLRGRRYTWSNRQLAPVFSKLDHVFLSNEWSLEFPMITLQAQVMIVSDHIPIILEYKHNNLSQCAHHIERL